MSVIETSRLPGAYHDAVCRWRDTYLPDFGLLMDNWEKHFPREPRFELCAYRDCNGCALIEVGEDEGKEKFGTAVSMDEYRARQILKAVRAQASTELGSIQQHQLTLSRAQDEEDQFWILRMMAEELRHGYQMFHLLLGDDWKAATGTHGKDVVEEILSMRTGNHVLPAFNVDFDSFVDNIVFCAMIDRVGKYQLTMQKVSAYRPMAESMPPMLREEAFHLAAGVVPLRRWMTRAAKGEGHVTMELIQKTVNKWFPRGLDMFGDERGGGTNVRLGFKPMLNREARDQYADEVGALGRNLNTRYLRTRLPGLGADEAALALTRICDDGETVQGVHPDDLLRIPHVSFFRRVGEHAYAMNDIDGAPVKDIDRFKSHIRESMPETYAAGRDFAGYIDLVRQVAAGEIDTAEAVRSMPNLRRVGGVCPCSRAVRWVHDGPVDE